MNPEVRLVHFHSKTISLLRGNNRSTGPNGGYLMGPLFLMGTRNALHAVSFRDNKASCGHKCQPSRTQYRKGPLKPNDEGKDLKRPLNDSKLTAIAAREPLIWYRKYATHRGQQYVRRDLSWCWSLAPLFSPN